MTGSSPEAELRRVVERAAPLLLALSEEEAARAPKPGKWSPKEVIGHLVDSASNNHQRFVRVRFQEDLVFPGYEQEEWVSAQRYAEAPWAELVSLFRGFNLHLARVMESLPEDLRFRPRVRHNLDVLAWRPVPASEPATLEYFLRDYVGHLKHHLGQVLGPCPDVLG